MQLRDIIRRSLRSLLSAKTRTLLTALAIAVGTFALTLTLGASNGAQSYVDKIINDNFDPSALLVSKEKDLFGSGDSSQPKEYNQSFGSVLSVNGSQKQVLQLSDTDISTIKAIPGVAQVQTADSISVQYVTRPGLRKYVATLQALNPARGPELLAGSLAKPLASNEIVVPEGFLNSLGFARPAEAIGKTVTISVQKQVSQSAVSAALNSFLNGGNGGAAAAVPDSTKAEYSVVAVSKKPTAILSTTELYMYASNTETSRLNDYITAGTANYHKYLTAQVTVRGGSDITKLHATQAKIKALGYGAQSVQDTQKFLSQIITVLQGIVTAFGFIAVVASLFGIVNTMYISVLQRTREIGLMKALGMRKKDITKLFRFEAALLGLLGGLLGSLAAVILGTALNPVIASKLGLGSQHLLIFKLKQIIILALILIVVATIAGLLPARKASRLNPIEALRTE
jgi:putative ABC transport system permease protein